MNDFFKLMGEILECDNISDETTLASLDTWDSLGILGVMSMVHAKYKVSLQSEEIPSLVTAGDLKRLVASRMPDS